ncbi:hypothetical protein P3S68_022770 [Capsicum galapagoense]
MDKDPLVLEKDKMQPNVSLSSSVDQVQRHSQNVERKVGEKLKLTFYNNRTVGKNGKLFLRHLGKIIHDHNICPLGVSSWSDISQEKLNHMWAVVEDKFEGIELTDHREHILRWMNDLWNKWRGYLYGKYVKNKPLQQALKNNPYGIDKKEWEWLVKEYFFLKLFRYDRGKDGNPPNVGTIFYESRKKVNKLIEPEAIQKHAQIEEIVNAEPSLCSIEIVEKCFGPQNCSHIVAFGGGVKAKDLKGGTFSKAELLSKLRSTQEKNKYLNEENKSLNERLSALEDEMKEIRKIKEFFAAQQPQVRDTTE